MNRVSRKKLPPPAASFEKYVYRIAIATLENSGVAFDITTYKFLQPMDLWEFPKYPSKTIVLPPDIQLVETLLEFISSNEQFLREPGCWLGTWIHPQTQEFYLDIATGCIDLEEAKKLALQASQRQGRKIVAIYNSKRRETVFL